VSTRDRSSSKQTAATWSTVRGMAPTVAPPRDGRSSVGGQHILGKAQVGPESGAAGHAGARPRTAPPPGPDGGTAVAKGRTPMDRTAEFRALHRPGEPSVLPTAWDPAAAAALAAAAGNPDAAGAARAETVRLARGMARLDALVTVDVEGGFGEGPAGVGALAAELAAAGAVGINPEDGRGAGLADPAEQYAPIR